MVICRANSGQIKMDHLKFILELVQALLIEHASGSVRKFQGPHSTDKNVPRLVETFSRKNTTDRKKDRPSKICVECYKNNRRKETVFWCPNVKLPYVLKEVLRHSTQS
jgi:hypothetical protein